MTGDAEMTKRVVRWLALVVILCGTVCACSLSAHQRAEIATWETEAAEIGHPEVKYTQARDPDTALALSFLPFGIAGFYVHRPGLGVTGILFWPLSIAWTAPVAPGSARNYNYQQFRSQIVQLREEARQNAPPTTQRAEEFGADLGRIDQLHAAGKISDAEYVELRRRLLERFGNGNQ
jgi:hypothetical protein